MVIPQLYVIRKRSCPMARRDKLWSFCTFCHQEEASPMTCRDRLWSFRTFSPSGDDHVRWHAKTIYGHFAPFVIQRRHARWHAETNYGHSAPFHHPNTIVSDGTQIQIMVILRLLSSIGSEPNDMRRQIMVIPHLFGIRRWNYGHSAPFRPPETNYGDFAPFCQPETIVSDGTQRQIMVILHLFAICGRSCPMARRDQLRSFCTFSPSGDNRVRWHAETNYGFSAPFRHPETIVSDGT